MLMQSNAISRQRVIYHSKVFTSPGMVNDVLDLVAPECEREDSRFLEPASGHGNLLAEVLRRRLGRLDQQYSRSAPAQWEPHALLGLACLYGIQLLHDNVNACRNVVVQQSTTGPMPQNYPLFMRWCWLMKQMIEE